MGLHSLASPIALWLSAVPAKHVMHQFWNMLGPCTRFFKICLAFLWNFLFSLTIRAMPSVKPNQGRIDLLKAHHFWENKGVTNKPTWNHFREQRICMKSSNWKWTSIGPASVGTWTRFLVQFNCSRCSIEITWTKVVSELQDSSSSGKGKGSQKRKLRSSYERARCLSKFNWISTGNITQLEQVLHSQVPVEFSFLDVNSKRGLSEDTEPLAILIKTKIWTLEHFLAARLKIQTMPTSLSSGCRSLRWIRPPRKKPRLHVGFLGSSTFGSFNFQEALASIAVEHRLVDSKVINEEVLDWATHIVNSKMCSKNVQIARVWVWHVSFQTYDISISKISNVFPRSGPGMKEISIGVWHQRFWQPMVAHQIPGKIRFQMLGEFWLLFNSLKFKFGSTSQEKGMPNVKAEEAGIHDLWGQSWHKKN